MKELITRFSTTERLRRRLEKNASKVAETLGSLEYVERVILFGSVASGKPTNQSDIDLSVVLRDHSRWIERGGEVIKAIKEVGFRKGNVPGGIDLVILAPEDFSSPEQSPVSSLLTRKLTQDIQAGVTLFDRNLLDI